MHPHIDSVGYLKQRRNILVGLPNGRGSFKLDLDYAPLKPFTMGIQQVVSYKSHTPIHCQGRIPLRTSKCLESVFKIMCSCWAVARTSTLRPIKPSVTVDAPSSPHAPTQFEQCRHITRWTSKLCDPMEMWLALHPRSAPLNHCHGRAPIRHWTGLMHLDTYRAGYLE